MKKDVKIAVVGATGNVGLEVLKALEDSAFMATTPVLLASGESTEETLNFAGNDLPVASTEGFAYDKVDIAIIAVPPHVAADEIAKAKKAGAFVIDASGVSRAVPGVPLMSATHLHNAMPAAKTSRMITLAEPLAASLATVLEPLQASLGVLDVVVNTYQTVSRAGQKGIQELAAQSIGLLGGGASEGFGGESFPHQIAFNVLPHVGAFDAQGHTVVEKNVAADTCALLGKQLPISVTCAFVPTFVGEAMSVHLTCKSPVDVAKVRQIIENTEGVSLLDNPAANEYSTPYGTAEVAQVFVSRVRTGSTPNSLQLWVVADHLRTAVGRTLVLLAEKAAHEAL